MLYSILTQRFITYISYTTTNIYITPQQIYIYYTLILFVATRRYMFITNIIYIMTNIVVRGLYVLYTVINILIYEYNINCARYYNICHNV